MIFGKILEVILYFISIIFPGSSWLETQKLFTVDDNVLGYLFLNLKDKLSEREFVIFIFDFDLIALEGSTLSTRSAW